MKKLDDYNLFDPETLKCPYDYYALLHKESPVHELPGIGYHLISSFNLIRDALRNPGVWSSAIAPSVPRAPLSEDNEKISKQMSEITSTDVPLEQTLLTVDPPDHAKHRVLVNKLFTVARIRTLVPEIENLVSSLIDNFIESGHVEFMSSFAAPLPLTVIRRQMGVPDEDDEFFVRAATAAAEFLLLLQPTPERALERVQLNHDLQQYFLDLCEKRRGQPRDDMLTMLVQAEYEGERPLRDGEILSILNQFLVAGHETTTSALGAGMKLLIENPDQEKMLREDPSLIKTFIEEILRLESPVQGLLRIAAEDTELGGVSFPRGSIVMLRYAAGNRDETMFETADRLDVCRKNAVRQLAFGSGVHACPGAPLARQELESAFRQILDRMENFANDGDQPPPEVEPSLLLRGLDRLHITFDKRT